MKTHFLLWLFAVVAAGMLETSTLVAQEQQKTADAVRNLRITANETITGVRTFDESVVVEIANGARFIKGEGGKLVFKRPLTAPAAQVFQGFAPGDVVFAAACTVLPEWWGAVGTGDPTTAAANVAALNAALAAGAETTFTVPLSGAYFINGKIYPRSGARLTAKLGAAGALKVVPQVGLTTRGCLIEIDGQSDVVIDGIELDGNRTQQTQDHPHTYGGIIAVRSQRCVIKNNVVHDCNGPPSGGATGNGIRTYIASDITIANNKIYSNNGCGINIYNSSHDIRITGNTIYNNCEIGIESEGRNGRDYQNHRNRNITIADNDITGSTEPNRLDDHSILVDWTDDAVVRGNHCRNSRHNGIEILGCRKIVVEGNHCLKNGDVGPPYSWAGVRVTAEGFKEDGRSCEVLITGNHIVSAQYGIFIDTADQVSIKGNQVTDAVRSSLVIGGNTSAVDVAEVGLSTVDSLRPR